MKKINKVEKERVIGGYSKQDSLVKITRDFNKSINKLKNKGEIR